jgi:hypothetical protein
LHPAVELVRLDDDLDALLRPAPSVGDLAELVRLCEELGFTVRLASFKPFDLPAVMTYPADAETVRHAASALDQGLFPPGFSGLVKGFVERRQAEGGDVGTLHLNANCPLIRHLASPEFAAPRKQAALAVIASFARLFCGRMLEASSAMSDLRTLQRSLDQLL